MKLSIKMALLFSIMMLAALLILSSYAVQNSVEGANAFTESRFQNMSIGITRDIEHEFSMMSITMNALTSNTSFMAAVNQFVRDDSEDQKMFLAARNAALQQLYQSPLVDQYDRVTFYTRDGYYLSSRSDKGHDMESGGEELAELIAQIEGLDYVDSVARPLALPPHADIFSTLPEPMLYGIVQRVQYHGKNIGYIEICNHVSRLSRIIGFVDEQSVQVALRFQSGEYLYSSVENTPDFPVDLAEDTFLEWTDTATGQDLQLQVRTIPSCEMTLYVWQDQSLSTLRNTVIRRGIMQRMLIIFLPTVALIAALSVGLTRSTRRLTRKVRAVSTDAVTQNAPEAIAALSDMVTRPADKEVYELETAYNQMMLRLRESTQQMIASREGTLQARLSALQTQINPHFIYNTLNIISAKSMDSGNFDVIEICDQFAQMLRYSTDTRSRTATLAEEIENVRNYLLLAKARYEDHLEFSIDVPEDLSGFTVPKLTLQPLVENALNHGFDGQNMLRRLSITGQTEEGILHLEIRDNGTGFSPEMLQTLRQRIQEIDDGAVAIQETGGHIGLVNTCLRLHYYSHGAIHVSLRNDNGAVVTIQMPCA